MLKAIFAFLVQAAIAATPAEHPSVRTLCAILDSSKKPYVIVDFKTDIATGVSETGSRLDNTYASESFPIKNYRLIASSNARYRVGVELLERAFFPGQFMFRMSIFEEVKDGLIQRFSQNVTSKELEPLFTFGTKPTPTSQALSCQVTKLN